jgi:hypothetical protein
MVLEQFYDIGETPSSGDDQGGCHLSVNDVLVGTGVK